MTNDRIYMDNIGYIYKATCKTTGLCYIGQTSDLERRKSEHLHHAFNQKRTDYNHPFYVAIREYGADDFTWDILEECCKKDRNKREIYWIKQYDSYNNGYNDSKGGYYCFNMDYEENRVKIGKGVRESWTDDRKKAQSAYISGDNNPARKHPPSDAYKNELKVKYKGSGNPMYGVRRHRVYHEDGTYHYELNEKGRN